MTYMLSITSMLGIISMHNCCFLIYYCALQTISIIIGVTYFTNHLTNYKKGVSIILFIVLGG